MSKSLLFTSRVWHRRIASLLFVFFFLIATTGLMLAWRSLFSTTVFEDNQVRGSATFKNWLPLDSLECLAARSLTEKTANRFTHSERTDIRLSRGYICESKLEALQWLANEYSEINDLVTILIDECSKSDKTPTTINSDQSVTLRRFCFRLLLQEIKITSADQNSMVK